MRCGVKDILSEAYTQNEKSSMISLWLVKQVRSAIIIKGLQRRRQLREGAHEVPVPWSVSLNSFNASDNVDEQLEAVHAFPRTPCGQGVWRRWGGMAQSPCSTRSDNWSRRSLLAEWQVVLQSVTSTRLDWPFHWRSSSEELNIFRKKLEDQSLTLFWCWCLHETSGTISVSWCETLHMTKQWKVYVGLLDPCLSLACVLACGQPNCAVALKRTQQTTSWGRKECTRFWSHSVVICMRLGPSLVHPRHSCNGFSW